jgi:molybdate transport system ATP-binding protein
MKASSVGSGPALSVRLELTLERFTLDVDFTTRHHVTGIFGASGVGKTSLLKSLAGLKRRARGEIRLGDEIWLDSTRRIYVPPERRGVGYVPQDGLLFPHLNVRRNLLAGADRARRAGLGVDEIFRNVCELLELGDFLERPVGTLSGGERQRVALGRAICSGPRLLLLDEPLASLDLPLRRKVLPFLRRVRDELEVPMLLVSHDPVEIQALCDEVIVLENGAILTSGPPRRVLTDPTVFQINASDGFENVLPATLVTAAEDGLARLRLGNTDSGVLLATSPTEGTPGDAFLVGIPSHEIILASSEPTGLTAQNLLPATVERVQEVGSMRLVTTVLAADVPEIAIEVTAHACEELAIVPGRPVFLVIKARSCVLYGRGG